MTPQTADRTNRTAPGMTPEEAIATLPDLVAEANRRLNLIRSEANALTGQWESLGRFGAQRADHAAKLLGNLRPLVRDLARYASACEAQIAAMRGGK